VRATAPIGGIRTSICSFQGTQPVLNGLSAGQQEFALFQTPGIAYLTRLSWAVDQIDSDFLMIIA
jgi:hypothetical protein